MNEAVKRAVPGWFWVVAIVALLWEAMGCYAYLTQITAADDTMPVWVSASFAVAVWIGAAGAILMLLRHRMARIAFAVSLLAVLVQFGGTLLVLRGAPDAGLGMAAAVVVAGLALLWFSDRAIRRGWLS